MPTCTIASAAASTDAPARSATRSSVVTSWRVCHIVLTLVLFAAAVFFCRDASSPEDKPKILFWYFPQFYETPENNVFWGVGYTDWTALRRSSGNPVTGRPLQRPTELGYYSLLQTRVRRRQGQLLKQYGGYGFIYHHYWFVDRPVLHGPLEQLLLDGQPDVPFFLNWVNQPWRRKWLGYHGHPDELLFDQQYPTNSSGPHFAWLRRFFTLPNYIKVRGMPVLSIHQSPFSRELRALLETWQGFARLSGFPGLFIIQVLTRPSEALESDVIQGVAENHPSVTWKFADRAESIRVAKEARRHAYHWRGLFVNWDNTPRMAGCNSSVEHPLFFERHLRAIFEHTRGDPSPQDGNFLIVNAWNEWGEGMVMEPSDIYGRGSLKAMRNVLSPFRRQRLCVLVPTWSNSTTRILSSLAALHNDPPWEAILFSAEDEQDSASTIAYHIWDRVSEFGDSRVSFAHPPPKQTGSGALPYTTASLLAYGSKCRARKDTDWMVLLSHTVDALLPIRGRNWDFALDLAMDQIIASSAPHQHVFFRLDSLISGTLY